MLFGVNNRGYSDFAKRRSNKNTPEVKRRPDAIAIHSIARSEDFGQGSFLNVDHQKERMLRPRCPEREEK